MREISCSRIRGKMEAASEILSEDSERPRETVRHLLASALITYLLFISSQKGSPINNPGNTHEV